MDSNIERLSKIALRISLLQQQVTTHQEAVIQAREEVKRLREELDNQQMVITDLQHKLKVTKLAHSIEPGADRAELKRKINEYLREIDHCIGLLND